MGSQLLCRSRWTYWTRCCSQCSSRRSCRGFWAPCRTPRVSQPGHWPSWMWPVSDKLGGMRLLHIGFGTRWGWHICWCGCRRARAGSTHGYMVVHGVNCGEELLVGAEWLFEEFDGHGLSMIWILDDPWYHESRGDLCQHQSNYNTNTDHSPQSLN